MIALFTKVYSNISRCNSRCMGMLVRLSLLGTDPLGCSPDRHCQLCSVAGSNRGTSQWQHSLTPCRLGCWPQPSENRHKPWRPCHFATLPKHAPSHSFFCFFHYFFVFYSSLHCPQNSLRSDLLGPASHTAAWCAQLCQHSQSRPHQRLPVFLVTHFCRVFQSHSQWPCATI